MVYHDGGRELGETPTFLKEKNYQTGVSLIIAVWHRWLDEVVATTGK